MICKPIGPSRRLLVAVIALLVLAVARPVPGETTSTEHHWIVLLDVSTSFERRDAAQNVRREADEYRVRDEALSLLQALLAARGVRELGRRQDKLSVFVFGDGVERVEELSATPIGWNDIRKPDWWRQHLPTGLGARTDYFQALNRAVAAYADDRPGTRQHLILISDGELDVGNINRQPGTAPGLEEMEVYRNLLRRDTDPLNWLRDHDVQVHTLAVDPALAGLNDKPRQEQIRRELEEFRGLASSPLEQALSLIESRRSRVDQEGRLFYNEGPYVLTALAKALGGEARSVRWDNVMSVLWKVLFPDYTTRRIVPFSTREVILFAPVDDPIEVSIDGIDGEHRLTLTYDAENDGYRIDPQGRWEDLEVRFHRTDQWVTWWVRHPQLAEIDPRHQLENNLSIVPVVNAFYRWREERPPREALGTEPIPLEVELVWEDHEGLASRDEWRSHLRGAVLEAMGQVERPNGTIEPIHMRTEVITDDSERLLRLVGEVPVQAEGDYAARAWLTIGTAEEAPQLKTEPVRFNVLQESPLSEPDRYLLRLRQRSKDKTDELVDLPSLIAGSGEEVHLDGAPGVPLEVALEWWGLEKEQCAGMERLTLRLPELDARYGRSENYLQPTERIRDEGRLLCYRTPAIRVDPSIFEHPLTVEARDGFVEPLVWRWRIDLPVSGCMKALIAGAVVFLIILAFLILVYWRWIQTAIKLMGKKLPVEVVLSDGQVLTWRPFRPRRFVIALSENGDFDARLTHRTPRSADHLLIMEQVTIFQLRVTAPTGPPWHTVREDREGRPELTIMVGGAGHLLRIPDLVRGTRLRFAQGAATVLLRHRT